MSPVPATGEAGARTVRAVHWAASVPGAQAPFDTLHLRIHHPARHSGSDAERDTGVVPADTELAPFPVVVLFPGINVGQESYRWLAVRLAEAGWAAVTFDWVGELFPGQYGLTPGVNVAALRPDTYGSASPTAALAAVLDALATVHAGGDGAATPLAGTLDLDRVALGGHSAGGTVALLTADRRWCPSVVAAFGYGAHTGASTVLGWEAGTVLPLSADCPVLLLGGTADGVIAHSAYRYGEGDDQAAGERVDPLARTLATLPAGPAADASRHEVVEGANHFSVAHPVDPTSARAFLDGEEMRPGEEIRDELARTIVAFLGEVAGPGL